jgi:hypothetical protein
MADTLKTIQRNAGNIDWEKLKENYANMMVGEIPELDIIDQQPRRRLTVRTKVKKTKKKKTKKKKMKKKKKKVKVPVMDLSSINLKKSKGTKSYSLHHSSDAHSKSGKGYVYGTNDGTPSVVSKSSKSGKGYKKKVKASKRKKTKCKKTKVPVPEIRSGKTYDGTNANKHEHSDGKGSKSGFIKGKMPKSAKSSKSDKSKGSKLSKSGKSKSSKLSKSGKHTFVTVCGDDEALTPAPSVSSSPSRLSTDIISFAPSKPSMSPSISQNPSLSNAPTKFGTTQPPSMRPSKSSSPSSPPSNQPSSPPTSQRPSSEPSPQPFDQTSSPTKTSSPTFTAAPTLEDVYRYDAGNCPNAGSTGLACSDPNLRKICDRYDAEFGSFRKCWEICTPAFCCIHDAENNFEAPSCSLDQNCAQYSYCYIVWFKFHDTFGPATFLDIENGEGGNGEFFDVPNSEVRGADKFGDDFFDQLYFHHFDNIAEVITAGTEAGNPNFVPELVFENQQFWQQEDE